MREWRAPGHIANGKDALAAGAQTPVCDDGPAFGAYAGCLKIEIAA
jgi:hypothetical protein